MGAARRTVLVILLLAFAGCADTRFGVVDGGRDAPVVDQQVPTDVGSPADGTSGTGQKMYAQSASQLFVIDPASLKVSLVDVFHPNAPDINDIAVTPDGRLYAVSINDLYQVNPKTAELTHVTKVEGSANVALTFEASGTLLSSDKTGMLRRIDPKTGTVTVVGSYGANLGASGDLVAIKDGTLFGVNDVNATSNNQLLSINPATGAAKIIGSIGYARVWGLAYWKGTVYGLTKQGDLLAINPKTGAGTLVQTYPYEFWGAAVTPMAPID
jgi:streptogramin lyase